MLLSNAGRSAGMRISTNISMICSISNSSSGTKSASKSSTTTTISSSNSMIILAGIVVIEEVVLKVLANLPLPVIVVL